MIDLPALTPPKWTQEQAVAFEAARECLGNVIAIHVASIATEEAMCVPNERKLAELETELATLIEKRRNLQLTDAHEVAAIRRVYGAQIRAYREQQEATPV